jgi:hypothetical protein
MTRIEFYLSLHDFFDLTTELCSEAADQWKSPFEMYSSCVVEVYLTIEDLDGCARRGRHSTAYRRQRHDTGVEGLHSFL